MKLGSVRVVTGDVAVLAAFYEQVTGISPVGFADYMELQTPAATLAICSQRSVAEPDAGSLRAAANRTAVLEFQVEDVDAERARLEAVVTDWVLQPTDQQWGNRSMLFRDPDGNLINMHSPAPH